MLRVQLVPQRRWQMQHPQNRGVLESQTFGGPGVSNVKEVGRNLLSPWPNPQSGGGLLLPQGCDALISSLLASSSLTILATCG